MQKKKKLKYVTKHITWGFGYSPQKKPSTIICLQAKALRLRSEVDTPRSNQNSV